MRKEFYAVVAYDCDGDCVGVADYYSNEEAAIKHRDYLLDRNPDLYDIVVETRLMPNLKDEFNPDKP